MPSIGPGLLSSRGLAITTTDGLGGGEAFREAWEGSFPFYTEPLASGTTLYVSMNQTIKGHLCGPKVHSYQQ